MQSDREFMQEYKAIRRKKAKRKRFQFPAILNGNVGRLLDYFNGDD